MGLGFDGKYEVFGRYNDDRKVEQSLPERIGVREVVAVEGETEVGFVSWILDAMKLP